MTTWAKDNGGILQYAAASEFKGIPNWQTHEPACRAKGYFPLIGEAEPREGYNAVPATWHIEQRSETHKELRREDPIMHEPFMEDIYEEDPETHEMKKVGERQVEREVDIVTDKSYIQIDTWDYEPIPVPPPESEPDTTDRDNAEKAIVGRIAALAMKYDTLQDLTELDITIPNLLQLAADKNVTDADLQAVKSDIAILVLDLMAKEGGDWQSCWEGLKSRFVRWMQEINTEQEGN